MSALPHAMLGLLMLAAFALVLGAIFMLHKGEKPLRPVLMMVCAAILVGNVLILTI